MTYSSDTTSYAPNHGMNVYYVIWGLFTVLAIFLPCLIFPRHRSLCFKRIRERRWNVSMDDDNQIGSSVIGDSNFRRRYPRDDPRYHVTKEESESLKTEFILKKLQYFTKKLDESDFAMKNALDFGKAVKGAENRRQSMLGHFPTPSDGDQQHQHQHQHKIPNQTNLGKQQSVPPISPPPPLPQDVEQGLDTVPGASTSSTPHDELIRVLRLPYCPTNKTLQDNKNITDSSSSPSSPPPPMTEIIPECCICLNDFQSNHVICWSPVGLCFHSFHEECIVKWFLAVCERTEASTARRRRGSTTTSTTRWSHDVVVECNLQCPVCRQDYITVSETTSSESSHSQQQQQQ